MTGDKLEAPCFTVHGSEGPFLLLVHGMLSGRSQWSNNIDRLSQICRPVVVELFGHGRSPSPKDAELYHPDAYVRQFELIRESVQADQWFVCGQSFGATLTFRYAHQYPERIVGHIFTNSISAFGGVDASEENIRRINAQADQLATGGQQAIERMPIHPKHGHRLPAEAHKALLDDAKLLNPLGIANTLRQVAHGSAIGFLHEIHIPNLLVCGLREKAFATGMAQATQNLVDLTLVTAEAGHAVNIQAPKLFNEAVEKFIKRIYVP